MAHENPRDTPLAQWLDAALATRGWSQRKLAEESGISQPRITQILKGGNTRRDTLESLARALFMGDVGAEPDRFDEFLNEAIRAAWPAGDQPSDPLKPAVYDYLKRTAGVDNLQTQWTDEELEMLRKGADMVIAGWLAEMARKGKR